MITYANASLTASCLQPCSICNISTSRGDTGSVLEQCSGTMKGTCGDRGRGGGCFPFMVPSSLQASAAMETMNGPFPPGRPVCWRNFFFFCLFRTTHTSYGHSQARGPIGASAAGLHHRHSNAGSKLHLQPTPQLMAMPDP